MLRGQQRLCSRVALGREPGSAGRWCRPHSSVRGRPRHCDTPPRDEGVPSTPEPLSHPLFHFSCISVRGPTTRPPRRVARPRPASCCQSSPARAAAPRRTLLTTPRPAGATVTASLSVTAIHVCLWAFFILLFMFFVAATGVCCCTWAFSTCGQQGLLSSCSRRPLAAEASSVAGFRV